MKKLFVLISLLFTFNVMASSVTKEMCINKGEDFIYVVSECIEYRYFEGEDNEALNIIVHGTWDEGTNTLGRYEPFAETVNLETDIATIAIALPGYSNSSSNKFLSLGNKKAKNLAAKKEYVIFVAEVLSALKKEYNAKTLNYIGHSAGAMIGATITGLKPELINNIVLAGGRYDIHQVSDEKNLISIVDVLNNVNTDINFLFIYGEKDKISKPEVTISFENKMKKLGFNTRLVEVKNAPHIDLDMSDKSLEAISELLSN